MQTLWKTILNNHMYYILIPYRKWKSIPYLHLAAVVLSPGWSVNYFTVSCLSCAAHIPPPYKLYLEHIMAKSLST